jgi:hypothetical protein
MIPLPIKIKKKETLERFLKSISTPSPKKNNIPVTQKA